jgi:hypothetical protein
VGAALLGVISKSAGYYHRRLIRLATRPAMMPTSKSLKSSSSRTSFPAGPARMIARTARDNQ